MSFKEFSADIKENKLKNVCLLYGKESFLSEWAENEIVKKYSNEVSRQFDVTEFDGKEVDLYQLVEACETLPLISDRKLVIVDRLPLFDGKAAGSGEKALLEYIDNPSETTILVFVCGEKIDKRKAVYKSIDKSGSVYEFGSLEAKDLRSWVNKRLKSHGKKISEQNLRFLIDSSGYYDRDSKYTLYHFENDISKIVLQSTSEEISREDIESSVSGNINLNIFMMMDCLGAGNKKGAFELLNNMFLLKENKISILSNIYSQYENVLNVKQLLSEGRTKGEIAKILNRKDFVINKLIALGRKYEEDDLKRIIKKIYITDKSIKTGAMDSGLALELLIASI